MAEVSELLAVVALVTQLKAGKPIGTATGFFYISSSRLFFVTNRHVVLEEATGTRPDSLSIHLHTDAKDLTKNGTHEIGLYSSDGRPQFYVHPRYSTVPVDIAVILLDSRLHDRFVFKALSKDQFLPDQFVLNPGDDAMVLGFPRGISDSVHNLPIIRAALLASAPGLPFGGRPFFLIDANLHPGTSGSPVLTRPRNLWPAKDGGSVLMAGAPIYFLGVHSSTLLANLTTGPENLGLATVWYAYLIEEIIASIPLNPAA